MDFGTDTERLGIVMIRIYTNRENYQYDLHALFKAFYPEQEVRAYGVRRGK